jgi:hypothetical protein
METERGPQADLDPAAGPPGQGRSQPGRSRPPGGDPEGIGEQLVREWIESQMNGTEGSNRFLKGSSLAGCSKMPGCKAPEILRSEAYLDVRRSDEG